MKRKPPANPFARTRRANQTARYLNHRQKEMHRGYYDRAGNSTFICFRDLKPSI